MTFRENFEFRFHCFFAELYYLTFHSFLYLRYKKEKILKFLHQRRETLDARYKMLQNLKQDTLAVFSTEDCGKQDLLERAEQGTGFKREDGSRAS